MGYSVFECVLADERYRELKQRLKKRVKLAEDSIRFYPLSSHTRSDIEVWGGEEIVTAARSVII